MQGRPAVAGFGIRVGASCKKQLDHLRWQKQFPFVSLTRTVRVYLADDVFEYIERLGREARYAQVFTRTKAKSA